MKEIIMPKKEIANILQKVKVTGLNIEKYQKKPEKFTKLPAITFFQNRDSIKRQFGEMVILKETYGFQIDVWGEKSDEVSKIVKEVKKQMLLAGYSYVTGNDLDDPSGLFRFTMIFERSI